MDELIRFDSIRTPLQLISWIGLIIFSLILGYYIINIGNRYVDRSKRIFIDMELVKKIILGILIAIITLYLLKRFPILGRVLFSAIVASVLAYILNPLVDKLQKRGINRIFGVLIVYASVLIIFSILIIGVVPRTVQEIRNLILALPKYAENFSNILSDTFEKFAIAEGSPAMDTILKEMDKTYENLVKRLMEWVSGSASQVTTILTHTVQNVMSIGLTLVLVLIMTFYFLVDKNKYSSKIQEMIPTKLRKDISYLSERINTILSEFIRGRVILAIFVGVLTAILLLIMRIDFAIVIGLITMVADIIPYVGPLLGFIPAFLFALIDSPIKALIVAIFYVLIQWAENNILAPKIIGDSMGLNPLFIFLAIVIGGGVFGVWGMVVSVPLAAVGLVIIDFTRDKLKERKEKGREV